MSYAKLPYGITDWSAGIQSINGLYENFRATYAAFGAEHGVENVFTLGSSNLDYVGHHNTPKVPRAVLRTSLSTSAYNVTTLGQIQAYPCVVGMARIGAGVYFIALRDLIEFYAECEAMQSSSTPYRVVVPRVFLPGTGQPQGIFLECYESSSGVFGLTDFDVCCAIYGTR